MRRAARSSWSRTASRPRRAPTASAWSYDGRLAELGSHDELVALGGHYAELYRAWATHQATPEVA